MNQPRHRPAESRRTPKIFLAFRICLPALPTGKQAVGRACDQFFLKRKGHFSLVFCPRSFWAGGGTNAVSVLRKLFFGERISQNTRLIFFEFGSRKRRRRGLGRNPPLAPLFSFGGIGAGLN
ncbi:MAG: hypothetical protein A2430_00860 [Candidatus Liptonbacteria bacterium RIFOXYC1_FULL_36_8]|uniref:Uncharacterized protein n=3 Tax=Candidatus Liptoniibacteriota TaxID=1817909 RepID=A0A1G2CPR9_9BACT|nr:MAG: hypothetical protein A2390_03180 [Candidatus Liptonbacteria bacterium RIFOXYB1_FULL_36_10]OGZ03853.1 MAG: hypothetical protein A2430_00860 [Candidatus Liptonbacteria bacterium RIFOXYC1_FULL_36_8]OGZ04287.1 MAG: hypothetical protein A2604_00750 [Candidatus Liptonbacteria bacterium RIFOXYD1_FULL_36_11]